MVFCVVSVCHLGHYITQQFNDLGVVIEAPAGTPVVFQCVVFDLVATCVTPTVGGVGGATIPHAISLWLK